MFLVKISFLLDIHVDTFNYDRFNSNLIRNIDNFRTEPITLTKYFCKNMQNDINVKKENYRNIANKREENYGGHPRFSVVAA